MQDKRYSRMLQNIISGWVHDWRCHRVQFILEITGTLCSMTASLMLAATSINIMIIFSTWLVGSTALAVSNHMRKSYWMFLLMSFYTVINIVGLYNHLH